MAVVFRADSNFFSAEHIGKALAQLYDVDALTFCLQPALDEEGNVLKCPFTLDDVVQNAAMANDGTVYQLGWIKKWLPRNIASGPGRSADDLLDWLLDDS